jgi:hypothetical protein
MCPRHIAVPDGSSLPVVRPDLKLESITYENFIKWFPPEVAKNIVSWIFCGTHGDPMMNKDVLKITEYVCTHGSSVFFNTNGGMRTSEFWHDLAKVLQINATSRPNTTRHVTFSIDGLEDTNHLYRRNVSFNKAITNAKAFIAAGGTAYWDYLIFKHNEHQVEEAAMLAQSIGFRYFVPKKALGFQPATVGEGILIGKTVRNTDGSYAYTIEPPSLENTNFSSIDGTAKTLESICDLNFDATSYVNYLENNIEYNNETKKQKYLNMLETYQPKEAEKCTSIICKSHLSSVPSMTKHEIYVDAYGRVFPCCYVATHYVANFDTFGSVQMSLAIEEFGLEKITLHNNTLEEILNSGFLQNVFEKKWGKDQPEGMLYCNETCGEKSAIDKIYTHTLDTRPDTFKAHKTVQKMRNEES